MNEMELLARLRDEVPAGVISARAETVLRDALGGKAASASSGLRRPWAQARWLASSWRLGPRLVRLAGTAGRRRRGRRRDRRHARDPRRDPRHPAGFPGGFPAEFPPSDLPGQPGSPGHGLRGRSRRRTPHGHEQGDPDPGRHQQGPAAGQDREQSRRDRGHPDGQVAYVANLYSASVTPIRVATGTALPVIKVGYWPDAIAITPDGKTGYVADSEARGNKPSGPLKAGDTVTPFRVATNTALRPIVTGLRPVAIVITPDGRTAYVVSARTNTVTPIRVATNTALPPITVGRTPQAIAITPGGQTAYVVNSASASVTPIRVATNTALPPVKVGGFPIGIAIAAGHN